MAVVNGCGGTSSSSNSQAVRERGRAVADVVECRWWLSSCLGNEVGVYCGLCTEDDGLSGEVDEEILC